MFLQVSICPQEGCAWSGGVSGPEGSAPRGVPGPGGCLVPGVPGPRGVPGPGGVPDPGWVPGPGGCLVWGGLLPGRCLVLGGAWSRGFCSRGVVSQHALRQTPLGEMATAADGMYPTGMHSCC